MARNDGTIERDLAERRETTLRGEIARLRGMLERETVARRDAQQTNMAHEANIKELDEQVTRLFKDGKALRQTINNLVVDIRKGLILDSVDQLDAQQRLRDFAEAHNG